MTVYYIHEQLELLNVAAGGDRLYNGEKNR